MRAVCVKVIGPEKRVRPYKKCVRPWQRQCETSLLVKSVSLKMSVPTVSSIILVSFQMPKCCNYLLKTKQQKESHYSGIKKLSNLLQANNRQTP